MAKGENIFRRRDGRWEARYIKGRELSGKIKYGYCYGKTYREAKEKVDKCKATLASGNPLPTSRTQNLFSTYCLGWLHAKKSKVKEATYIKYSTIVEKHITPKLGACCPFGFTTELMDDFIKELQFEDELAPKTVHDILVVLHGILKFTASKVAGTFPTVEINYPKIGKKEMRVLSREEQARFISYLQKDLDPCRFGTETLSTLDFIESGLNICILGPSDSGKSYLAKAIGIAACNSYKVEYHHCESLLEALVALKAQDYAKYQKRLKKICGAALLILDDFLLHTITDEREVKILFEILEKRCEINLSTIICSQREPASWSSMILNDEVSANAILKRATKHYTVVIKPLTTA